MQLWRFLDSNADLGSVLKCTHNSILILLSIFVACLAGYAALAVVNRIVATKHAAAKRWWLIAGAMVMGCGIWAMHFTAMLSFTEIAPYIPSLEAWDIRRFADGL